MNPPQKVETEEDYEMGLRYVEYLMEKDELTEEDMNSLEHYGHLIYVYEEEHFKIVPPKYCVMIKIIDGKTNEDLIDEGFATFTLDDVKSSLNAIIQKLE